MSGWFVTRGVYSRLSASMAHQNFCQPDKKEVANGETVSLYAHPL